MGRVGNTRITLIERIQNQHDDTSWDEFVSIYRGFIFGTIRNMGLSTHDSEDLVQQVLLSLWKKLPDQDVRAIKCFRNWMTVITKNCVVDFMRKRMSEKNRLEKAGQDDDSRYLKSIRLPDIDAIAEKQWKTHITHLAIQRIQPEFTGHAMNVFRLSLEGVSTEKIASQFDIKVQSVYRLRCRVKVRLTQEIEFLRSELEGD